MEKQERDSSLSKTRKPRVKSDPKFATVPPPTLLRSKTTSSLTSNSSNRPRVARINTTGLSDREKARSGNGFFSDSDEDSSQSNKSANSNISVQSSMSFLNKTPSIMSDTIIRVRPKSSLGTLSEKSSQIDLDVARQFQADRQADEARMNRKIADLEISIKCLTTKNAELDEKNKKQAEEIIKLKRMLKINDTFMSEVCTDDDGDSSTPLTETDLVEIAKDNDVRFKRICCIIDELLNDAQEALERSSKAIGTKVLPNAQLESKESKELEIKKEGVENTFINNISSKKSKKSKARSNIETSTSTNQKLKIKTSTNPKLKMSPIICENGERVREVVKELLNLAKQDTVNNKKSTPQSCERKGLGLLLSIQNGRNGIPHTPYNTTTNNNVDKSPPSPTITLLYELQELLGIGDAESSKFANKYRKSCPIQFNDSNRTQNLIQPNINRLLIELI
ncbi:37204_t:CDS:2 [Gigaspora margarita]|uniref:37204_t:CDS:1 n=1 Tax=Gigaspora margarita TaxID=4874 RepID=A0ABN7UD44_GIGMA|nr:37204_t:CDS:2 [Gigaspora margarita]